MLFAVCTLHFVEELPQMREAERRYVDRLRDEAYAKQNGLCMNARMPFQKDPNE